MKLDLTRKLLEVFNEKPVDLPVVAVTGGKGGTGKTTVAVNLAAALTGTGRQVLLVDTDVDSPTTSIVLGVRPTPIRSVEIFIPKIVEEKCVKCGKCAEVCRAHALVQTKDRYPMFFEELCLGCEACLVICDAEAITAGKKTLGTVNRISKDNLTFIGGELNVGEARSAEIVVATKDTAFKEARKRSYDIMIVDTAPGTHCNVVQGLRAADLAIAVTEPTPLGIYDLKLILQLSRAIGISTIVVINKSTLPGRDMEGVTKVAAECGIDVLAEIPVDKELFISYVSGKPLVEVYPNSPAAKALKDLAELVSSRMKVPLPSHEPSLEMLRKT